MFKDSAALPNLRLDRRAVCLALFHTPDGVPDDLRLDLAEQRFMAERASATIVTFDDASHAGGFTHYVTRFTKLIEDAAEATAD